MRESSNVSARLACWWTAVSPARSARVCWYCSVCRRVTRRKWRKYLAEKTATLRIFADDAGKMNRSLVEISGAALVVSQFTLYGDARGQRRPSFIRAAPPDEANRLFEEFCAALRSFGVYVQTGIFRAIMAVELTNEGPVTILLDSEKLFDVLRIFRCRGQRWLQVVEVPRCGYWLRSLRPAACSFEGSLKRSSTSREITWRSLKRGGEYGVTFQLIA